MLTKEQTNAAADAILAPARDAQVAAQENSGKRLRIIASQQYIGRFGIAGLAIGAIVGYAFFDNIMPLDFVGMGIGFLLGSFNQYHAAKPIL